MSRKQRKGDRGEMPVEGGYKGVREPWNSMQVTGMYHVQVVRSGKGLFIRLPKMFIDRYDVKMGDILLVEFRELTGPNL